MRGRLAIERFRSSLFFFPAVFVVAAIALSRAMLAVDGRMQGDQLPDVVQTTVDSARAVLATVAAATITAAAVVFSITVVSAQLAASQFSPRVMRVVVRDRLQQAAMGWMVGTFTYSLVVLQAVRGPGEAGTSGAVPNLSVAVAGLLAIGALLAILAYVDRSARLMRVGHTISRITDETIAAVRRVMSEREMSDTARPPSPPLGREHLVRARTTGWIQGIDSAALLCALPPGSFAKVEIRVGHFAPRTARLVRVWLPDDEDEFDEAAVARAVAIGGERVMTSDIAFGIRQLVDIGLRALSPGVNDVTTAYEVVVHLEVVLREILTRTLPPAVEQDDRGTTVVRPLELEHDDYVRRALEQLRIAAAAQPAIVVAICNMVAILAGDVEEAGFANRALYLRDQARLAVKGCERSGLLPEDVAHVRTACGCIGDGRAADRYPPPMPSTPGT